MKHKYLVMDKVWGETLNFKPKARPQGRIAVNRVVLLTVIPSRVYRITQVKPQNDIASQSTGLGKFPDQKRETS